MLGEYCLCGCDVVCCCDFVDDGFFEEVFVVFDWILCFGEDVLFVVVGELFFLWEVWVYFDLVDYWMDFGFVFDVF